MAWVPDLGGWLVTGYAAAVAVLRDWRGFTVDDPRFSTARVVGPSMLSLDGTAHARHRAPFAGAFHHADGVPRLAGFAEAEAARLVTGARDRGAAEIRRDVSGPLAVAVAAEALGLRGLPPARILSWYARIAGAVTGLSADSRRAPPTEPAPDPDPGAAAAFADLAASLRAAIRGASHGAAEGAAGGGTSVLARAAGTAPGPAGGGRLSTDEVISDAAVVLFGGIDTTDGMITNAVLHLLSAPDQLALVRERPGLLPAALEESLRLEPAAALLDRYAARDTEIDGARIRAGDRVSVSVAAANRDPAVFAGPDRFDIGRPEAGRHLAFARGPHFCIGAALARAETQAAVGALLGRLPGLRLAPGPAPAPRGLVFRKPPAVHVTWDAA